MSGGVGSGCPAGSFASQYAGATPAGSCHLLQRAHPGCVVAGERIGLHLGDADVFFDFGPSPELPIEDMKQVLAELTVASDDPTTWFDLKTALGG